LVYAEIVVLNGEKVTVLVKNKVSSNKLLCFIAVL